jgi:hypothetical protein
MVEKLKVMDKYDRTVTRPVLIILTTIFIFGALTVFALYNYGGEIGLITHEEPRLAYLFCREEIKNKLNMTDYKSFDNYLDATIYTIQAHQFMVQIGVSTFNSSHFNSANEFTCNIIAKPDGTWQITATNSR